jgi:hypothetical protein
MKDHLCIVFWCRSVGLPHALDLHDMLGFELLIACAVFCDFLPPIFPSRICPLEVLHSYSPSASGLRWSVFESRRVFGCLGSCCPLLGFHSQDLVSFFGLFWSGHTSLILSRVPSSLAWNATRHSSSQDRIRSPGSQSGHCSARVLTSILCYFVFRASARAELAEQDSSPRPKLRFFSDLVSFFFSLASRTSSCSSLCFILRASLYEFISCFIWIGLHSISPPTAPDLQWSFVFATGQFSSLVLQAPPACSVPLRWSCCRRLTGSCLVSDYLWINK